MARRAILTVDADARARAEFVRLCRARGYEVRAVASATEALDALHERAFGCAVVDVVLEDMPGLEAIELLRRLVPRMPIIVTAARNTRELEAEVRKHDVTYYHVKEFGIEELLQAVARATGGAEMSPKARILIVDDDRDYQAAMRQLLENAGYEVLSAYTKQEGEAALKKENPDLVILDIMMTTSTDGFHFLYEMRAEKGDEMPPVLSVSVISKETGYKFSPTEDGDYFPADEFLPKPVDPQELLARVEALLARRRQGENG